MELFDDYLRVSVIAEVGSTVDLVGKSNSELFSIAIDANVANRSEAIKLLSKRMGENQSVDFYVEQLSDPSSLVTAGASDILVQHSMSAGKALRQIAGDAGLEDNHRLWVIYTLLRMGETADNLLAQIPNNQIPLPAAIPQVLRDAIVREWAGYSTAFPGEITRSDIRWLIEKQQISEDKAYEAAALIEKLRAELQAVGLKTGEAIDCGEYHAQGGGTYWLLPIATDEENIERYLYISKLGPFVSYVIHVITQYERGGYGIATHLSNFADRDLSGLWQKQSKMCRQVAEGIGFIWVAPSLLDIVLPDLCDPYPYEPDEMKVSSLLYYWVD